MVRNLNHRNEHFVLLLACVCRSICQEQEWRWRFCRGWRALELVLSGLWLIAGWPVNGRKGQCEYRQSDPGGRRGSRMNDETY